MCSELCSRQFHGRRGSRGLLQHGLLGYGMLLPRRRPEMRRLGSPDGRAVCLLVFKYPLSSGMMAWHTGSFSVSQNSRSITVITRPGFSGVPRWSVLRGSV